MSLVLDAWRVQEASWPKRGRQILAQWDDTSIVVYQAYGPRIGDEALALGRFGPAFRLDRWSWIKPSFLWMMHRCEWGRRAGMERILAIRLSHVVFQGILRRGVLSSFEPASHGDLRSWRREATKSDVRVQWDPDYTPDGRRAGRRAIQIGLRGDALARYAHEWATCIEDVTPLVAESRALLLDGTGLERLRVPLQRVYPLADDLLMRRLGMLQPEPDRG